MIMDACRVLMMVVALWSLPASSERLPRTTSALPELSAPPQGTAQWIARSMRLNGLPMTLKAFESRLSPDGVLAYYESKLKSSSGHETRRLMRSPWQVLMFRSQDHFITVHARPTFGGSEGTILVSPALDPAVLRTRTDFPRPPTAHIVNLQQYNDAGMQSEHIALSSARAPFVEAQAFSQLLIREGWTLISTRPTHETHRGFVLEAQRDAEHALLVIIPDTVRPSSTAIVVTWKKS